MGARGTGGVELLCGSHEVACRKGGGREEGGGGLKKAVKHAARDASAEAKTGSTLGKAHQGEARRHGQGGARHVAASDDNNTRIIRSHRQ